MKFGKTIDPNSWTSGIGFTLTIASEITPKLPS